MHRTMYSILNFKVYNLFPQNNMFVPCQIFITSNAWQSTFTSSLIDCYSVDCYSVEMVL